MSGKSVHVGGCLCGKIRFEALAPALNPHTCSCKMCQRHSGALTTVWVEFPSASVIWNGPGGEPATYRSSDFSCRAFCPNCGSTLGAIDDEPVVALLLGAFDSASSKEFVPVSHSYPEELPAWWHIDIRNG